MAQEHFHSVAPVQEAIKAQKGLTKFVGNGTPNLELPGCKKVRRVFIGDQELPEKIEEVQPYEFGEIPNTSEQLMWKLERDGATPILLRSLKSNDGIWQDGQAVFIDGDFEKPAAASVAKNEAPKAPAAEKKPEEPKAPAPAEDPKKQDGA